MMMDPMDPHFVPPIWWWLPYLHTLPPSMMMAPSWLRGGGEGIVSAKSDYYIGCKMIFVTHEKIRDKTIYHHPYSILGPTLSYAIFLDHYLMISSDWWHCLGKLYPIFISMGSTDTATDRAKSIQIYIYIVRQLYIYVRVMENHYAIIAMIA